MAVYLILSILLLLAGHAFRLLRWEQFVRIYERPRRGAMLRGMAGGYAINTILPLHLGDVFRAVFVGRRMKSGVGFALATVIMDRFLDVWFVAVGFGVFALLGQGGESARGAARYYLLFAVLLAVALVVVVVLRDGIKRICLAVCGIFNDTLKLDGMVFCWSLINTFKDLRRVNLLRLAVNTVVMWAAYLGSYTALAAALTAAGQPMRLVDVFGALFGQSAGDLRVVLPGGVLDGAPAAACAGMIAWYLVPLVLMWLATLLPEKVRGAVNQATAAAPAGESYLNLLPQADPQDRAVFLSQYFGLQNKAWVDRFLQMNQDITILQDFSAGSNATTMLCMDKTRTFYRKYAFGADGQKLAEQLHWLRAQKDRLPLCEILRAGEDADCCWYDMTYDPQAVGMFRYLHSNPVEKSAAVLHEVLDTLEEKLYHPTATAADAAKIEQYIGKKVDGNLQKLREARTLHDLMEYPTVWINGREYKNLSQLDWLFAHERLQALFAEDPVATIHGDLTIENIICRTDDKGWYLIDPNTGNLHESPFLDYGKLLQSLHGGYEFMMMTPRVTVQQNHIDFALTRSAAYDALFADLMADLGRRYPRQLDSILMHEVIHWLRLMPYKLSKDRKRAAMFYAGLVMVANDAADHARR
ncbi:MAG TPA: flippase-like domain-containing protein [Candidatus Gemmiger excrementigallinarum]|uniref:Phosphatidylglycerol lysyltransferase n=1 Tax=Candidatus Gemmiger excrementigallinarum TaxID=2838609 RepID=A0A9D2ET45_9FIRM|nr:flippase-like domain-containing protein [Candidatus Gemmiger excrementigallinarum]